jgi:hypothetical protein
VLREVSDMVALDEAAAALSRIPVVAPAAPVVTSAA